MDQRKILWAAGPVPMFFYFSINAESGSILVMDFYFMSDHVLLAISKKPFRFSRGNRLRVTAGRRLFGGYWSPRSTTIRERKSLKDVVTFMDEVSPPVKSIFQTSFLAVRT
jgi:hypothetical protein